MVQGRLPGGHTELAHGRRKMQAIMEFRVLGPIELWSAGQQCVLGSNRARCVLANLLLTPGTTIPAEALIDRVWDTRPPRKARETLSVYITRLRASLRQAGGDRVRLVGRARGYELDVDPEAVDLHQFRRLRRQADALIASGDPGHAAMMLREADGLWRGQALAGIRGDWMERMRDSLESERRAAILIRVDCELRLGRHSDLVGELGHLLAQYPLDETLVGYQMTALYVSGRPGDALSLYRDTRSRLVEEQGAEPGPMLSELYGRILRHDLDLAPRADDRGAGRTSQADMLPPEITDFVGRSEELALLTHEQHDAARVNVIEGNLVGALSQPPARPGGAGPASPEVMSAFELSYRSLEPGHQRLFRRLGLNPCPSVSLQAAAALSGSSLAEADKALTVLLDHHLIAQASVGQFRFHDLIREYAATCAEREESRSERREAVGKLLDYYLDAAVEADRVLHPFRQRLPGPVPRSPSASPALRTPEGAAGWLESEWRNILQAARYAHRHEWKQKCADLTHAMAGFLEVRAYWSEAIAAHTLALQASRDAADPARTAQASLDLGEVSQQTGRHDAALALAEDAAEIYRSLADRRGEAEALDQAGMTLARAGRFREALAYFREARIDHLDAASSHGVARTLSHAGIVSWQLGRYSDAVAHLQEALSIFRDTGDRRGQAKALNNLGEIQLYCGYHRDALESYQKSLEIFREIGGAQNEAILYHNIGSIYHYKGYYEDGLDAYRRALTTFRSIGDLPNESEVLNGIGAIYRSAGRHDEALIYHEKARSIAEEIGNLSQQLTAIRGIADVRRECARYDEALDYYNTALSMAIQIGDAYQEAKVLEGIGEATLSARRPDQARIVFRQALDIFERLGVPEAESARIRIEAMDPSLSRRTSLTSA